MISLFKKNYWLDKLIGNFFVSPLMNFVSNIQLWQHWILYAVSLRRKIKDIIFFDTFFGQKKESKIFSFYILKIQRKFWFGLLSKFIFRVIFKGFGFFSKVILYFASWFLATSTLHNIIKKKKKERKISLNKRE